MTIKTYYSLVTPAGANEQSGVGSITQIADGNSRRYSELGQFASGLITLDVSAVSGTATPTLTVRLQQQHKNSGKWETIATFPPQTAVTDSTIPLASLRVDLLVESYRLAWAITGTNPSFTFSAGIWVSSEEAVP